MPDTATLFRLPILPANAKPIASPRPAAPRREPFIGFTRDAESAEILHRSLAGALTRDFHMRIAGFQQSLVTLAAMSTPEIILVDLSGEEQPLNAMMQLADVVDPSTIVLAIGEIQSLTFYRTITKGMGVRDYLAKPLTQEAVENSLLPLIANVNRPPPAVRGGRMATVVGARGGIGTTTIATNLAWYIANEQHRHTVLLDGELNTGTVALDLNLHNNNGLGTALEMPERVDKLLIERSMQEAGRRLHVLAGLEDLQKPVLYTPGGTASFIEAIRARYNFAVADAGSRLEPFARDLLSSAQQRVIVMDPSMISIRNLERLLGLPSGPLQSQRTLVVLNKAGTPGGLSQSYMEQSLGLRFDAVIPDLPRIVPRSTQLGTQAASLRGSFRNGIAALTAALGATTVAAVMK